MTSLHEPRGSWQQSAAGLLEFDWLSKNWTGVNTVLRAEREREVCCCRQERTACIVGPNFQGAKCIRTKRETRHKTSQHFMLTVDLQQQLCWSSFDLFTCTEGYWLRYNYKCSPKHQIVWRENHSPTTAGTQVLSLAAVFSCFWPGCPFEHNWQNGRYEATKHHIFVTAPITIAGWLGAPIQGWLLGPPCVIVSWWAPPGRWNEAAPESMCIRGQQREILL